MSDKEGNNTCACVAGATNNKIPLSACATEISFHANRARARANPAPNTPAGWSRVAWFGCADELVLELVVEEVELRDELGDVVVEVPPVVVVVGRVPVVEEVGPPEVVVVPEEAGILELAPQRPSK
jgi:hypothetical protein